MTTTGDPSPDLSKAMAVPSLEMTLLTRASLFS
jgi:hypothetical protein